MWRKGWAYSIPIYIQQDATLHSLFTSGNCSTRFGWYFHLSSEAHTPASTASCICHTVTAICRYRGKVGTGLSVLWVAYAKVGYCYPSWLEKTLCKWEIYVPLVTKGLKQSQLSYIWNTRSSIHKPWVFPCAFSTIRDINNGHFHLRQRLTDFRHEDAVCGSLGFRRGVDETSRLPGYDAPSLCKWFRPFRDRVFVP
jgi:hypothetical protein